MIRGSRMLLNMSRDEQKLQEVIDRCHKEYTWFVVEKEACKGWLKWRTEMSDVGVQWLNAEVAYSCKQYGDVVPVVM